MSDETKPDLPATTEEAPNTTLDAVTDLALDSTIPVPIRRNVLKALDRLGSALIDIPVGALERRSAEKRAESEARIKITEAVNAQIIQQLKVDPEFPQRASNTFAKKILREQYNLEKILGFATDILKKTKADNATNENTSEQNKEQVTDPTNQGENTNEEKTIDDDWFNVFEKEASQKSSDDMQRRFGRVLAGEIEKPGSYSIKAVKILGEMDQKVAMYFKKLCSLSTGLLKSTGDISSLSVITLESSPLSSQTLEKYGLSYRTISTLQEYGLASNSDFTYLSLDNLPVLFRHQEQNWAVSFVDSNRDKSQQLQLFGIQFSRVAQELYKLVDQYPIPEYTEDLKRFLVGQNLNVDEVDIISINKNKCILAERRPKQD